MEDTVLTRLQDLVESHGPQKINSFLDESFECMLRESNLTGPPMADNCQILTELKDIIRDAAGS